MTIWDGMAKIIGGGFPGEEKVSYKEHKVHEGPELDFLLVAGVLNVFTRPEAEVEANGDQVVDVVGSGVVGAGCSSADGVNYSQGDGFFSLDGGILDPIGLEFPCEALVDPGVCLRVGWFYGVGKTIQGVGRCNCPPCLRNRFFPISVHLALGVLGVPNTVAVDSEELDVRDG